MATPQLNPPPVRQASDQMSAVSKRSTATAGANSPRSLTSAAHKERPTG